MKGASTFGQDIAKSVSHAPGAHVTGRQRQPPVNTCQGTPVFFAAQPRCLVTMEACGSSHHWAREIARMGHEVKLIPPIYVKPFVKRQKNDLAVCR